MKRAVPLLVAVLVWFVLPARAQTQLPDGNGKEIVESACTRCHSLNQVVNAGYTRADWQNTIAMMVNAGAPLTPDQAKTVVDYLAQNFPEKPAPEGRVIAGPVEATIREWPVPTPGSRPHDPLAYPDGSIWYSGQMANVLGRLDPKTGTIKEYHLPPRSGPHGLVADKDGHVWYTANFAGYIGELDPKTGAVKKFPLPDPSARDPHTPLFDKKGNLWFTVQSADFVGRLIPATGEIKLVRVPTPRANPYGMVITSKGVPYFDEFGTNKLASIDPETLAITEYPLPNPQARPRRIAITPDDVIYYSDYGRGYLGRFDPKTGKIDEWPSPGGPRSRPYAMTYLKGAIWYSESGTRPNTLVRFDLKTQTFQSWTIPSGGDVVRNMMATKDGNIVMACSGANRIALVTIK